MLKFVGEGKRGKVYFLGLTRENINKLISGQPIPINLADMGGPNVDVCLLFGETERMIFNLLKSEKLIPEGVELRDATPETTEVVQIKREEKGG
jgi:hypothetical protein